MAGRLHRRNVLKTLLKGFGYLVGFVVVVVILVSIGSRFTDGPTAVLAGGSFSSGEAATEEPDWSFVKDYITVEFQLLDPARSRTTWIVEHEGRIFIPCGYMDTTLGRMWKQWPIQAEQDGRAILRVDGKLYNRQLVRIKDDPAMPVILSELGRKYMGGGSAPREMVDSDSLWIFEMVPSA